MAEWTQESLEARREELANPIKLYLASGEEAGIWACAVCRYVQRSEEEARGCWTCAPVDCKQCGELSEPRRVYALCRGCLGADFERRERQAMDAAEQVRAEDWSGGVVHGDRFFGSVDELLDALEEDGEVPDRAWATQRCRPHLDADQIVEEHMEQCLECVHDGYDPEPNGMDELRAAVKAWNEAQTWSWWEEDRSRVVVFEGDEAKERLEAAS